MALINKLTGLGKVENLQRHLLQADIYLNPGTFISIVGILGCLGFIVSMRLKLGIYCYALGPMVGCIPILFLRWKKNRKTAAFEKAHAGGHGPVGQVSEGRTHAAEYPELVAKRFPRPWEKRCASLMKNSAWD